MFQYHIRILINIVFNTVSSCLATSSYYSEIPASQGSWKRVGQADDYHSFVYLSV